MNLKVRSCSRILAMIMAIALIFSDSALQAFAFDKLADGNSSYAVDEQEALSMPEANDFELNSNVQLTDEKDDPQWGREHGYGIEDQDDISDVDNNAFTMYTSKYDGYSKTTGIDVSKWQGSINWSQVKAAGMDFAIIRVGYRGADSGSLSTDSTYATNLSGAQNAGIKMGVYIFSQAITPEEAREEARYAMSLVKGYNISLPIVMDFEFASNGGNNGRLYNAHLSKDAATAVCLAFCETVKAGGYEPMVYANKSMLTSNLNAGQISSKYKIWLAHYVSNTDYAGDYTFWQYSDKGSVSGISGNVDMNYWYHIPQNRKITYVLDGGTNDSRNPSGYTEGTNDITLYDATRDGYVFRGWYTDEAKTKKITKITSSTTGDLTLYAKWELNAYIIKYDANAKPLDRKASGSTKDSYMEFGKDSNKLRPNGYKVAGYKFIGWNTRSDGKGHAFGNSSNNGEETIGTYFEKNGQAKKIGDTITLYAQWQPVVRVVTFYKNGSEEVEITATESVLAGDKISEILDLKSDTWRRPGYKLAYWTANRAGKGKKYTNVVPEEIFKNGKKEADLFAQWKPEEYKITYDADGGKNDKKNPKKYTFETPDITLNAPVKKGFTFVKWVAADSIDPENAPAIEVIKRGSNGNLNLKAVWKENVYFINYHVNDLSKTTVSENMITVSYNYTGIVNTSEAADYFVIAPDYADSTGIVAWTLNENGKGKSYNTAKAYYKLSDKDGAVIDVYAKWGGARYSIIYDMDGGNNPGKNPLCYIYNNKKSVKIKNPSKKGYIFKEWQAVSGNTVAFQNNKIAADVRGSVTLKATWTPIKYTVKFNINTKDKHIFMAGSQELTVLYEDTVSQNFIPDINVPEFYKLKGWNTKANGKGVSVSMNALGEIELSRLCTKNNGKITLYAQWEPAKYNITYVNIDPDNNAEELLNVTNTNPSTYSYGKGVKLKNPLKYGFVFKGWYLDKECTKKATAISKTNKGDITLYGKWKVK